MPAASNYPSISLATPSVLIPSSARAASRSASLILKITLGSAGSATISSLYPVSILTSTPAGGGNTSKAQTTLEAASMIVVKANCSPGHWRRPEPNA